MYDKNTRTPQLYLIASQIAKQVSDGKGSIKSLVFAAKHPNLNALRALVSTMFQKMRDIEILLNKSKFLIKQPGFDPWLAKILITELLWGKKRLPKTENKKILNILAYEQIFKAHLSDTFIPGEDIEQVPKPRYVRVNTLKISVQDAITEFEREGWVLKIYTNVDNYAVFLEEVANLAHYEFMVDLHIPYLLIFPPRTRFIYHAAYRNGYITLQDKASCLAAHFLNPEPGSTVLDMCAAPGMKTTQLAAVMEDKGTIYAVEKLAGRFETLKKVVGFSGANCIKMINEDTLNLTEKDFPDVEYILVDPSCSGSGITDRVEVGQQKMDRDPDRLAALANLQVMILKHALIRYSKVKRVVYSTCSMFPEENEDVVRRVLENCTNFKLVPAGRCIKDVWLHYGSSDFGNIGQCCLYARPDVDLTTGFFVAIFERLRPGERNPFCKVTGKKNRINKNVQDFEEQKGGASIEEGQNKIKMEEMSSNGTSKTQSITGKKGKSPAENNEFRDKGHLKEKNKKKRKNLDSSKHVSKKIKIERDMDGLQKLVQTKKKKKNKGNVEKNEDKEHKIDKEGNIKDEHCNLQMQNKKEKDNYKTNVEKNDTKISVTDNSNSVKGPETYRKKKKHKIDDNVNKNENEEHKIRNEENTEDDCLNKKIKKKKKKDRSKTNTEENDAKTLITDNSNSVEEPETCSKKKKIDENENEKYGICKEENTENESLIQKKKKKDRSKTHIEENASETYNSSSVEEPETHIKKKKDKSKKKSFTEEDTKSKTDRMDDTEMKNVNQMENELNSYLDVGKKKKRAK